MMHMIKLCVGVSTLEELESYRAERAHWWGADYGEDVHVHRTRTMPKRRDEIEVLRLVGGTDGFVAAPFVVEGALQGLAGGLGGALLVALLERVGWPAVAGSFGFGAALLPEPSIGLLGVVILSGLVVGVVASTVSVLRFLRALS